MTLYTSFNRILIMIDNKNFVPKVYFTSKFDLRLIRGKNQGFCFSIAKGFFLGTFRTNSWELNFSRTKIFQDILESQLNNYTYKFEATWST